MKREPLETLDHTVSGLLRKRAEMFHEAERLRDRLAEIKNDIDALDRTLGTFGYAGDLDAAMPRQKREVIFGRGELSRALMRELRDADGPLTSRELAQSIVALKGDARDRSSFPNLLGVCRKRCGLIAKKDASAPRSIGPATYSGPGELERTTRKA